MSNCYLMFGIRRSGNHLIRNWVQGQLPEKKVGFANCNPDVFSFLSQKQNSRILECDNVVLSIEETDITAIDVTDVYGFEKVTKILILRDPFNLYASRIRHYGIDKYERFNTAFTKWHWKEYAQAFKEKKDIVTISYNDLVTSSDYRKQKTLELGLDFNKEEDNASMMHVEGGNSEGSSFDQRKYDGKASEMKVSNRWEEYKHDINYLSLFDLETKNLSKEIFNFCPF